MSFSSNPSSPMYSPNGPPPLVPKRRAPPPPTNWTPPVQQSAYPSQPARPSQPSFQPSNSSSSQQAPISYSSQPPLPNRDPPSSSQPNTFQNNSQPLQQQQQQQQGGFLNSVSKYFWGDKEQPPQANRDQLLAGATPPPPLHVPNANDQHWDNLRKDKDAETQYYQQLAQRVDTGKTDYALQKAKESEELGKATLEELVRQGDSLNRVERDVETIHLQLDRGDRQLRSVSGIAGSVANMFSPDKATKQQQRVYDAHQNTQARTAEIHTYVQNPMQTGQPGIPPRPQASSDGSQLVKDKLAEQDRQLELLSASLTNLTNIAGTINEEISSQNKQLDRLNTRTDQATKRTFEANYKVQRLM